MKLFPLFRSAAAILLATSILLNGETALAQTETPTLPACSLATPVRTHCFLNYQTRGSTSLTHHGALNSALSRRNAAALAQCKSATGARSAKVVVLEVTAAVYGSGRDRKNRLLYYAGGYGNAECVPITKLTM